VAKQFSYFQDPTLARGINAHESVDQIPEGYVQEIVDGILEGKTIRKREGTEILGGDMPISVERVVFNSAATSMEFILPSYVNLTDVTEGPLRLNGKIKSGGGNNPYVFEDVIYSTYTKLSKLTLVGSLASITASQAETGFTTVDDPFALIVEQTGELAEIGDLTIDTSDFSTELKYEGLAEDVDIILYKKEVDSSNKYNANLSTGAGEFSKTITAATHALNTENLLVRAYEVTGTLYKLVPVETSIDASGNVTIENLNENTNYRFGIYKASTVVAGVTEGTAEQTTIEIPNAESEYLIADFYQENVATGELTKIFQDTVSYDETTNTHTITFDHPAISTINYSVHLFYGQNVQNRIEILDSDIDTDYSTSEVSLVISGILQSELDIQTFVNYLDVIRLNDKVVAGADGNMLKLIAPSTTSYALSQLQRTDGDQIIAPLFYSANPTTLNRRTTGYIVSSGVTSGTCIISSVEYNPSTTYVKLSLNLTGYASYDGSGNPVALSSVFAAGMYVDVIDLPPRFEGRHEIKSITEVDSDTIVLEVDISDVKSSFYDIAQTKGVAGVYTNFITFLSALDVTSEDIITLNETDEVVSASNQNSLTIQVEAATVVTYIGNGTRLGITGSRTDFPLSTAGLVAGDSITVGDVTTQITKVDGTSVYFRDAVQITEGVATISHPFLWSIVLPQNEDDYLGVRPLSITDIERSVNANNQLIFAKNVKYNGDTWETQGIPNLQSQLFAHIDESVASKIDVPTNHITIDTTGAVVAGTTAIPVTTVAELKKITEGSQLLLRDETNNRVYSDNILTVTDIDTTGSIVTVTPGLPADATLGGTFKLATYVELDYFVRVAYNFDETEAVGPSTGSGDLRFRLTAPAAINIRAFRPTFANFNFDNDSLILELFRREDAGSYRKILQNSIGNFSLYVDFVDAVSLLEPGVENEDPIPEPLSGRIGETRSGPFVSENITNIDNQIIKSNLTGEETLLVDFTAELQTSDLNSTQWTIDSETYEVTTSEITPTSFVSAPGQFTINTANTAGLGAGDYVYICKTDPVGIQDGKEIVGWWIIDSVVTNTSITILHPDVATPLSASDTNNLKVFYSSSGTIPLTAEVNYQGIGAGIGQYTEVQNAFCYHLAGAINWKYSEDSVFARGGRDVVNGRLSIYNASALTIPATIPGLFVNGTDYSQSASVDISSVTPTYPSRIIASLKNYTDIYTDIDANDGVSLPAIEDVNPDDGEIIIGAVPFFSQSAFGAAMQSNALVIFKPHNIYLLDVTAKYSGATDYLKRVDVGGKGCDAPHSISQIDLGIMYAGRGGIYLLDKSLNARYIGKNVERLWEQDLVDLDNISRCCANNFINGRRYSLSVPVKDGDGYTDKVMVFKTPALDGTESDTSGWALFSDKYNATMWANSTNSTLFANATEGFVGIIKQTRELTDYSDRGEEIELSVTFRPMHFSYPSLKKFLRRVSIFFTSMEAMESGDLDVEMATNLNTRFDTLDVGKLSKTEQVELDNLSDVELNQVSSLAYSPKTTRGNYFQLRVKARGVNRDFVISQVIYKVAMSRQRGVLEASQSDSADSSTVSGD